VPCWAPNPEMTHGDQLQPSEYQGTEGTEGTEVQRYLGKGLGPSPISSFADLKLSQASLVLPFKHQHQHRLCSP
jgi:hypothetical protein